VTDLSKFVDRETKWIFELAKIGLKVRKHGRKSNYCAQLAVLKQL